MNSKILIVYLFIHCSRGEDIYFEGCDHKGFKCTGDKEVTYECVNHPSSKPYVDNGEYDTLFIWNYVNERSNSYNYETERRRFFNLNEKLKVFEMKKYTVINCHKLILNLRISNLKNTIHQINIINVNNIQIEGDYWPKITFITNSSMSSFPNGGHFQELKLENVTIIDNFRLNQYSNNIKKLSIINCTLSTINLIYIRSAADQFTLNGNTVEILKTESLQITSSNVEIIGNSFQFIEENAFEGIQPNTNYSSSQLAIEGNIIQQLQSNSLDISFTSRIHLFDNISFVNNKINCSCRNVEWLGSLLKSGDNPKKRIYYNQILRNNNYCLNENKCSLNDIANKHELLCYKKLDNNCFITEDLNTVQLNSPFTNQSTEKLLYEIQKINSLNSQLINMLMKISNNITYAIDNNNKNVTAAINSNKDAMNNNTKLIINHLDKLKDYNVGKNLLQPTKGSISLPKDPNDKIKHLEELMQSLMETQKYLENNDIHHVESFKQEKVDGKSATEPLIPSWFFAFVTVLLSCFSVYFVWKKLKYRKNNWLRYGRRSDSNELHESIAETSLP